MREDGKVGGRNVQGEVIGGVVRDVREPYRQEVRLGENREDAQDLKFNERRGEKR